MKISPVSWNKNKDPITNKNLCKWQTKELSVQHGGDWLIKFYNQSRHMKCCTVKKK